MNVHLSNRQKIYFAVSILTLFGFLLLRGVRANFSFNELLNLSGIALGGIGALLGLWQAILAINASNDAKEASLQATLNDIRSSFNERDRHHDQRLADIQAQLEQHQNSLGHTGALEQILQIKDQVSDLRAALAMATRQGEIFLKLERLEKDLERLKNN